MFRVTMMVEDRKLAEVLRVLAGKAHNVEPVPVSTEEVVKSAIAPSSAPRAHGAMTLTALGFKKGDKFTSSQFQDKLESAGRARTSYWYLLDGFLKAKQVRKLADKGHYEVTANGG